MAHGTYDNPRAGTSSSKKRMKDLTDKVNSDEKAAKKFTRKSNRQYEKSKRLEAKGKDLRAAKADMKSSYYMERAKDLRSSDTPPNVRYHKNWKNK